MWGLGERDEAFAWLNRAYEERSYILAEYLTTDARLDTLHNGALPNWFVESVCHNRDCD